jgi:Amt family ammonium transporter
MLTGFVYPVVVYLIWSSSGWITAFNADPFLGCGMHDFAGSGVVHMIGECNVHMNRIRVKYFTCLIPVIAHITGGMTALIAAKILGPCIGRFTDSAGNHLPEPVSFPPHSAALQVLGTFILWVGGTASTPALPWPSLEVNLRQ